MEAVTLRDVLTDGALATEDEAELEVRGHWPPPTACDCPCGCGRSAWYTERRRCGWCDIVERKGGRRPACPEAAKVLPPDKVREIALPKS